MRKSLIGNVLENFTIWRANETRVGGSQWKKKAWYFFPHFKHFYDLCYTFDKFCRLCD